MLEIEGLLITIEQCYMLFGDKLLLTSMLWLTCVLLMHGQMTMIYPDVIQIIVELPQPQILLN